MAVVAFLRQFQCNGNSKHMKCQSNRHTHHLLSENDGQLVKMLILYLAILLVTAAITLQMTNTQTF